MRKNAKLTAFFPLAFLSVRKSISLPLSFDDAAVFASERQRAGDQKITSIDGGVTIEFTSSQFDKVLKWVLSCGCNAVPRKPERLADDWKWHISEMRKQAALK